MKKKSLLSLFPNLLSEGLSVADFLPSSVDRAVKEIDGLIAESERGGRLFLKQFFFTPPKTFRDIPLQLMNEHTRDSELETLLKPILQGQHWGLVSDCGLPCIADPGSKLVYLARQHEIEIQTFSGPSSLLFALLLSGLPAQSFAFHGYLERDASLLKKQLHLLERRSFSEKSTQVFIEAPYRSQKLLKVLVETLDKKTLLSIAWDLSLPTQKVMTLPIETWQKRDLPHIEKRPTVFLFYSSNDFFCNGVIKE